MAHPARPMRKSSTRPGTGQADPSATTAQRLPLAIRRHPLVAEVARQLAHCGVPLNDKAMAGQEIPLVVGVSGGPDSLTLLLTCAALAERSNRQHPRLRVIAAHVNHHLRPSADDDARYVQQICERFGLPLHVEDVRPGDVPGNVSANARLMRYEALLKIARRVDASFIAVAHHGNDQIETILMALGRGAGLDGLSGMPWSRPLWEHVMLIRPLLGSTKEDCLEFCRRAALAWREDPFNLDPQHARARLRRDVVPVMEELWPDLARRITATAEALQAARRATEWEIEQAFGDAEVRQWDRAALAALSVPVLAAGLRRAALDAAPDIADDLNQRHLIQAAQTIRGEDRRPHRYHWPGDLELKVTARHVALISRDEIASELAASLEQPAGVTSLPAPEPVEGQSQTPSRE